MQMWWDGQNVVWILFDSNSIVFVCGLCGCHARLCSSVIFNVTEHIGASVPLPICMINDAVASVICVSSITSDDI